MMRGLTVGIVVALLAGVLVLGVSSPVTAAGSGVCRDLPGASLAGGELDGSTPVVLVHGFNGSTLSWFSPIDQAIDDDVNAHGRSFVEQLLRIDGVSVWVFDYHDTSARWVTDPSIGPALADLLECLADNGGEPAVLVVHSMGGLAARYALGLVDDPGIVSGMVTFGTPNLGSDIAAWMSGALGVADVVTMANNPLLGVVWSFVHDELDKCAAAKTASVESADCGWVDGVPPLGSEAGIALQRGSTAIKSLPSVPDNVSVLAIAGQMNVVFQESRWGFFYSDIGEVSIGDTAVMVDSAIAGADETDERTCQLNLKTGYAISDDFRQLAGLNYDDGKERGISALMSNPCQHSHLTRTVEFTNQALGFVSAIVDSQSSRWETASAFGDNYKFEVKYPVLLREPLDTAVARFAHQYISDEVADYESLDDPGGQHLRDLVLRPDFVTDDLSTFTLNGTIIWGGATGWDPNTPVSFDTSGTEVSLESYLVKVEDAYFFWYDSAVAALMNERPTDASGLISEFIQLEFGLAPDGALAAHATPYSHMGEWLDYPTVVVGASAAVNAVETDSPLAAILRGDVSSDPLDHILAGLDPDLHFGVLYPGRGYATDGDHGTVAYSFRESLFPAGSPTAAYSGCSPGTSTTLPDGVWVGYIAETGNLSLDFDLACLEWDGYPLDVTNSNPGLRTLRVAPDSMAYIAASAAFGVLGGSVTHELDLQCIFDIECRRSHQPYWDTYPQHSLFVVTINGGFVTEIALTDWWG